MLELKVVKIKEKNNSEIKSLAVSIARPSPLTDSFIFNPSFLMLPDIIFNNTPIPFL